MLRAQEDDRRIQIADYAGDNGAVRPCVQRDCAVRDSDSNLLCFCLQRQCERPAVQLDALCAAVRRKKIAAAGQPCSVLCCRMENQRLHIRYCTGTAIFHDADCFAVAIAFTEIMADPRNRAGKVRKQIG